jgi:uncharacterized protein (DUF983 family)
MFPMWRRLGRGLVLRCANCGQGGLFRRWLTMVEQCPRCGHRFERQEGYWLGAIALNTFVTMGALVVTMVGLTIVLWPDPPWNLISIAVISVTAVMPVLFYPFSKTIWVAMELSLHPVEED